MNKKYFILTVIILLLFAGYAMTDGADEMPQTLSSPSSDEGGVKTSRKDFLLPYESVIDNAEWLEGVRWYRSNKGGMALEEIQSRFVALRNEYALAINFARYEELPEALLPFFDDEYFIEIRMLYENGVQIRTQWIFRDAYGTARLVAVLREHEATKPATASDVSVDFAETVMEDPLEFEDADTAAISEEDSLEDENASMTAAVVIAEEVFAAEYLTEQEDEIALALGEEDADENEKSKTETVKESNNNYSRISGFIEIFDENSFLTSEYRYFDDGNKTRTDFNFKNGLLLSSTVLTWEEGEKGGEYVEAYAFLFRYNRSLFLRSIERVFYVDRQLSSFDDAEIIYFSNRIMDAVTGGFFTGERQLSYPEFFGEIYVIQNNKIIYTTGERGRILTQTLYDSEDNVVWVIENTWKDDRIVSISKKDSATVLMAEYEYDSSGDRIVEKNFKNGVLERAIRQEGSREIEELYLNNVLVLVAVWEDGRKITETRAGRP